MLTASGDTERLEIKEDGSTQLVDGTLTVPKAITMMRRTKVELIKQGTIHHGVELSGKKHEVEILKAVIAVENELTKKSGEGSELLFIKGNVGQPDQKIVREVMEFYTKEILQFQQENAVEEDEPEDFDSNPENVFKKRPQQ